MFPHAGSVFAGLAQTINSGHTKCSVGRTSPLCPGQGTVVNDGWFDRSGLLSTFVNYQLSSVAVVAGERLHLIG